MTTTMTTQAKFYDIAAVLTPDYDRCGFLKEALKPAQVRDYILAHPVVKPGDILFLGSTYQTRQEYGFAIVLPESVRPMLFQGGEYGSGLPLDFKNALDPNLRYDDLMDEMEKDEDWGELWFGNMIDSYEEALYMYMKNGLTKAE